MRSSVSWRNSVLFGVALVTVTLMLSGCFGGGSSSPPKPQVVSLSGTVTAPSGTPVAASTSLLDALFAWGGVAYAAPTETPVRGATVMAFSFGDGKQVGTTATTDSSGRYTISQIPKDIDVVIIAVKEVARSGRNSGRVRLCTLVPNAGTQTIISADISGASSVAAEAWGIHYRKGLNIGPLDFKSTLDAARAFVGRVQSLDLTEGGPVIGEQYGGGLQPSADAENVEGTVPTTIDGRVWPAKEMIQDLRDAGLSLKGTYEEQLQKQKQSIETKVGPYLSQVADHVGGLHTWIISLPSGVYEELPDGTLNLVGSLPAGHWQLHRRDEYFEDWTATYTNPGTTTEVPDTVAFEVERETNPDAFDFGGVLDIDYQEGADEPLPIRATLDATLRDASSSLLEEPTTFDGDYEAEFSPDGNSVQVMFRGVFSSSIVNATGELTITADAGAGVGNVEFSGDLSTDAASVHGSLDLVIVTSEAMPGTAVPRSLTLHGSLGEPGASNPIFDGNFEIEIENAAQLNFNEPIDSNNWPKGHIAFGGSVDAPGRPKVSAEITLATQQYQKFSSSVNYSHNGHTLEGTVTYDGITGEVRIQMTNQAGLVVAMQGTDVLVGTIKDASGTKIADIAPDADGLVRVTYIDGSWETLL